MAYNQLSLVQQDAALFILAREGATLPLPQASACGLSHGSLAKGRSAWEIVTAMYGEEW